MIRGYLGAKWDSPKQMLTWYAIAIIIGVLIGLWLNSEANAHNVDCDNNSTPTEMKSGCCGKEDYRALKPNAVRQDGEGYDVFLDGKWRQVIKDKHWLIAQPTGAPCWGVWYRQGKKEDGEGNEQWRSRDGNTEDYNFFCLEQPASF